MSLSIKKMDFRKLNTIIKTIAFTLISISTTFSEAAIIDSPHFKFGGVVILWSGDEIETAAVSDLIIEDNDVDLIPETVMPVVVGQYALEPDLQNGTENSGVLDESESFAPFLSTHSDSSLLNQWKSSFFVASNTAFSVRAQLLIDDVNASINSESIHRTLVVDRTGTHGSINFGSAAQYPHSNNSAQGGVRNNGYLSNLESQQLVFTGNRKTALRAGTIVEQSVRFTSIYNTAQEYGAANDIKTYVANVVYTVSMP